MPIVLDRLDSSVLERLTELAKIRNVSIEDQIVEVLRTAFADRRDALLRQADVIASMTPKGIEQTDSTILIREDRDR